MTIKEQMKIERARMIQERLDNLPRSYTPKIICHFGQSTCLCQWCENPCNDGLNCHECGMRDMAVHCIQICSGFVGTYPNGLTSWEIARGVQKIKENLEQLQKDKEKKTCE